MGNSREKARVVANGGMRKVARHGLTLSRRVDAVCWRYQFLMDSCPIASLFAADELNYMVVSGRSIEVEKLIFCDLNDAREFILNMLLPDARCDDIFRNVYDKITALQNWQIIVLVDWLEGELLKPASGAGKPQMTVK